ncbi:efflux RND transporter periplasmic adaptor subunit [Geminicoccus roseus]|uniref:efflux RND transporter periplasmic adaptor subunit n=1 Tax=Geminicoccus roseus TaxID=404900 RepID=UPI000420B60B|nr:efflux RND transporter periplasmic adaptor subunit [Geminicoccus roseus]
MPAHRLWPCAAPILVLLALLPPAAHAQEEDAPPPPAVVVQTVEERPIASERRFIGRVEAIRSVDVRARVQGFVEEVEFEEGALVSEGDLLFTLDARRFQAAVRSAEARLAGERAALNEASQALQRQEQLVDREVVSEAAYDSAIATRNNAQAQFNIALAELQAAQIDLDDVSVVAPIGGRIGPALLQEGAVVGPQGQPLARIVQIDPIRVVFSLTEGELVSLRQGETRVPDEVVLELELPNGSTYGEAGEVDFIGSEVDPDTGTVPVRVMFPNPDGILLPGQFVDLVAREADPPAVPVVPATAVLQDRQGRYVFVLNGDDTVRRQDVAVGPAMDDALAIEQGLEPGSTVVVQGVQQLADGQRVTPSRPGEEPAAGEGAGP